MEPVQEGGGAQGAGDDNHENNVSDKVLADFLDTLQCIVRSATGGRDNHASRSINKHIEGPAQSMSDVPAQQTIGNFRTFTISYTTRKAFYDE
jgi:hypothetical protein